MLLKTSFPIAGKEVPFRKGGTGRRGFTLIELVVVVALIGILTTLSAPTVMNLHKVASRAVCASHMRSLHCSFGAYLNDNEQWPQPPENASQDAEEQFWMDAVAEYGAPESVWKCPALTHAIVNGTDGDGHKIHYAPTEFDDNPMTPRRWAAMPWLIEIADGHGSGHLLIRADGAVKTVAEAMSEQGD